MARRTSYVLLLVIILLISFSPAASAAPVASSSTAWAGNRWIEVDLTYQWLVAYEGYTPIFESAVSTGTWEHPTPEGEFSILWMVDTETMSGSDYYLEDVPYVMYFADYLAIHGTYWHDNFGVPMSHGCVNLPTWAAEWLYDWAGVGTTVWIHY